MWKLPDGRVIRTPDRKRMFIIDDVQHPELNLLFWNDETLASYGIFRFVEVPFDQVNFRSTGHNDVTRGQTITRTHTIEPKIALDDIKKIEIMKVRREASSLIEPTNWYQTRELDENSKPMPTRVLNYRIAVRAVAETVESAIKDLATHAEVIAFEWADQWPSVVDPDEPIVIPARVATPTRV